MPRLLADTFLQQATVQSVVDEVPLLVKARVAGQTTSLQEWYDTGGAVRSYVDNTGNVVLTNTKGAFFNMASGNQGYVAGTAANQLDIRGGSAGFRILNNAGSVANISMTDAGVMTLPANLALGSTMTMPNLGSITTATPTNQTLYPPAPGAGIYPSYSPISRFLWHDMLAFSNAGWGTPLFETYTGSWAADTLNTAMFSQLENQAITVIDGSTKTAARWTWTGGNVSWCYSEWWLMAFTYSAIACTKDILIESSVNGSTWTTRHTSTGNSANAQPVFLYETNHAGDGYLRVTITVTNAQPLLMSSMRAFTTRWGNQGAGAEYSFPYAWDGSQRMAIGAGAAASSSQTLLVQSAADTKTLVVKGFAGQANDLQQWVTSANTYLGGVSPAGVLKIQTVTDLSDSGVYIGLTAGTVSIINWNAVGNVPLQIKGVAGQTGDLQQWKDSTGASLAKIRSDGMFLGPYISNAADTGPFFQFSGSIAAINRTTAGNPVFVVQGMAAQSGDLQRWQDSTPTVLAKVDVSGNVVAPNLMNLASFNTPGVVTVSAGVGRFRFPFAATIRGVTAAVNTAPTGASLICDVNKNGTTIFTTQSNRPTIAISGFATTSEPAPNITAMAAGDYLTVDVDQVGSTIAGSDLTVFVRYTVP